MIDIRDTTFYYNAPQEDEEDAGRRPALSHISLNIVPGEFVAFLGRNGSGKSSLSRLLNGIELPTEGTVSVEGHVTSDKAALRSVRRAVQIVFQNPENQQVGITVGEDISFGLSNIGWPQHDIADRVAWAIKLVGLDADEDRPVMNLSGGEKQKLALAAVLALAPRYLILDEATSMLDPVARRQFVATLHEVRKQYSFTLIYITHHLEEVTNADRWVLFQSGKVVTSGTPDELMENTGLLQSCGLELPYYRTLAGLLREQGIPVSAALNERELRELLCKSG
ncbi:ATP-binding cassette domain-containing protein [Paenibacillus sp. GCM10012307]|uniref:ATP-binding cassette domain-containing protein n=1 Tax=Paenibacillus roseus TaxID=2798579 RepID=A0A934J2E7_9BACL|nr:ATP-binding cassette domain-containing protein [Paenibacillus roseus]MBJ6361560.1 ATP-binding cassette domain-containing protein [Paenibacillus roseus]